MERFTCLMEELDTKTQEYLRLVRSNAGRRCPGMYFPQSNPMPVIAIIVGPIIAIAAVVLGMQSIKDAWATAMLQTAGVLLGGWMCWYALRRWMGTGSPKYAGFFTYFDVNHVFQTKGENVNVMFVDEDAEAKMVSASNNMATVRFESEEGVVNWTGLTVAQAELVQDFYTARNWIREKDETGKNLSGAVLGGASREFALTEELPRNYEDLNLEVDEIPEEAQKARKAVPGFMRYLFIIGATVLVYAGFASVNSPIRDAAAWEEAQKNGAPGYRAYLLDKRNTRHRDDAKQKLAEAYDPPIQKIKMLVQPSPLQDGMVQLLESLKTSPQPVCSIRVTNVAGSATPINEYEKRTTTENLGDALAISIGEKLISFIIPEEDEKAYIEVQVGPLMQNMRRCEVFIRTKVDGEPVAKGFVNTIPQAVGGFDGGIGFGNTDTIDSVKNAVLMALVGEVPARPVPLNPDDGDW